MKMKKSAIGFSAALLASTVIHAQTTYTVTGFSGGTITTDGGA